MYDNDVVCMQFSVIFYKLLKLFGINASLEGDMESHFYVIYNIGSMVIKADGTRYGYYDEDADVLGLSDLANVKFGFRIKSLELYRPFYKKDNKKYWNFNNKKLEAIIDSVYSKLAYIQEMDTKFDDFIDFMLNKQLKKKEIRLKKEGIHNPLLTNKQKAKVNQSFVRIPLLKFKNRIKYLCEKYNLIYEEVNESYTSMKSFYDNDELNKESLTSGKRIKRGLYETKDKRIINADVNGALNIYKKSKPINDKSVLSLMDRGLTVPFRVKVFM